MCTKRGRRGCGPHQPAPCPAPCHRQPSSVSLYSQPKKVEKHEKTALPTNRPNAKSAWGVETEERKEKEKKELLSAGKSTPHLLGCTSYELTPVFVNRTKTRKKNVLVFFLGVFEWQRKKNRLFNFLYFSEIALQIRPTLKDFIMALDRAASAKRSGKYFKRFRCQKRLCWAFPGMQQCGRENMIF